jgi:hypothetical protein
MSIIVIIFILYYNSKQLDIACAFILPFSLDKISYFDEEVEINTISVDNESNSEMLYLFLSKRNL